MRKDQAVDKNWIDIFRKTVADNREKTAVIHGEQEITFEELNHKAVCIAKLIRERTSGINRPIAVLLPKSIGVVYSDIGITYSHNIFSNLDVKTPKERLNNIISTMKPVGVITDADGLQLMDDHSDIFMLDITSVDFGMVPEEEKIVSELEKQIDTDPFCIINTSGSTGTPKGVVLNHKSFFDFMEWSLDAFHFGTDEIIGALSPVVFDIYDYEICLMMAKGATIVMLDAGLAAFPARLLQELQNRKVTFMFWVPTIMVNIANMDLLSRIELPSVKTIWFAGEVFPTKQFNYWKSKMPQTVFANLYGPIEITLDCIYYIVDRTLEDDEPLPIGIPCNNTDILLLNDEDKLCAPDEEGEICVRGTSLSMGYYNNWEKTQEVFVQNPLNKEYPELIYRTGDIGYKSSKDQLIYFKGRKDSLVKHMGYRIELGEIEHVIVNDLKAVKNCCAVYDYAKKEIVLFYEKQSMDGKEIRKLLGSVFPRYMIPTSWKEMDELPRNTNGKIDRLFLSETVNN